MYVLIAKKEGGNEMQVSKLIYNCTFFTRRGGLVVERRTLVQEEGGSILTQVAIVFAAKRVFS